MNTAPINDPSSRDHQNPESFSQFLREWGRFIIEIAAFVALVLYVSATQRQVRETVAAMRVAKEANQIARKQLEASQRSWIGIDAIEVTRTHVGHIGPGDVQTQTTLIVKNFGHSLATDISMNFDLARPK